VVLWTCAYAPGTRALEHLRTCAPVITVLVNPKAGGNTNPDASADIAAAFAAAGATPRLVAFTPGDDIAALVRDAAKTSDVVVAAGGDGTVSTVAGVLAGTETALGVLPAGTLNHFARDLKLPAELDKAAAVIVGGAVSRVDVADVNGHLFVNNSSIGVYPNAVEIRETLRKAGRPKWIAMAMATWHVLRTYRGIRVQLTVNGRQIFARTPFVFVGNNEYVIEGRQIGAREHLTSGKLFVYLAPRITTRQLPVLLLRAVFGYAIESHAFEVIPTSDLKIETVSSKHITVSLDGETTTLKMPLHYQARPGALRVIS
jgi:diacylglycerol kinase family enzyme